jgi:serine protease Do
MKIRLVSLLLVLSLLLAACGSKETESNPGSVETAIAQTQAANQPVEPEETDTPAPTEAPSLMITNLQDVVKATVQIEAVGTFIDPEFGMMYNTAGRGTGFIINEAGLAVTNNHVVAGAATLEVWVGGENSSRNARILGISECNDLAVIDIEGDGYNYLPWFEGDVNVGLDVYTAGFPLGDPEFTMTKGIVSKAKADGESSWASVDAVVEHDATINPGNSGGPLINTEGQVVGINYAGNSSTNQYFAIKAEDARPIIERLVNDEDVETLGINPQAVIGDSFSGIWVASVVPGSPADKALIKAGDIVTSLQGIGLAEDGTLNSYCDILRTYGPSDTLSVEVLRYATDEYLAGKINANPPEPLSTLFSLVAEENNPEGQTGGGEPEYSEYVTIYDDTGVITVDVPAEWGDINGSSWTWNDADIGPGVSAASDLEAFYNSWTEPGIFFGVTRQKDAFGGEQQLLLDEEANYSSVCTFIERAPYTDVAFEGEYLYFEECGGEPFSTFIVLVVHPIENPDAALVVVYVALVADRDFTALDNILNSFDIVGDLP